LGFDQIHPVEHPATALDVRRQGIEIDDAVRQLRSGGLDVDNDFRFVRHSPMILDRWREVNDPTIQRSNSPTVQQSNSPTVQRSNGPTELFEERGECVSTGVVARLSSPLFERFPWIVGPLDRWIVWIVGSLDR
jgi:hypothetical protein